VFRSFVFNFEVDLDIKFVLRTLQCTVIQSIRNKEKTEAFRNFARSSSTKIYVYTECRQMFFKQTIVNSSVVTFVKNVLYKYCG